MRVREARDGDTDAACAVLEAAFRRPDEAQLLRRLIEAGDLALTLVAVGRPAALEGAVALSGPVAPAPDGGDDEGPVVGVAVLSRLSRPENAVGLGPLAVAPGCSDRGVGKALIGACIERAREAGHGAIFVLGQPPYYTRFGFSVEAARPFRSDYPADYLMALELRPGALPDGGELRYPPAFAAL